MANLNDLFTKFCLNNLINYVIYLLVLKKKILIGSLLTYVVRIFFWRFTKLWIFFLITTWILEVEIKNKDLYNLSFILGCNEPKNN